MASNDPAKVTTLFTEDAEFLTQELPTVKSKENIQQYLRGQSIQSSCSIRPRR
jgi:hypothetical protein